ncbi:MAG: hypothetical protein AAGF78_01320 [Pseudomonadota bacterium]
MRLILHIGAHRTGSTLIERMLSTLALARPELALRVWKPGYLRAIPQFKTAPGLFASDGTPKSKEAAGHLSALRADMGARLAAAEGDGVTTLLISEENICGGMWGNFRKGRFYPGVAPRLRAFAEVFGRVPARVALGIREYGAAWNSAYGYLDRADNDLPPKADVAKILSARPRGWPALVSAMREAWPASETMLWRQEDLGAVDVAAQLCDLDPALLDDPGRPVNATGSAGGTLTEIFTPAERKRLARRYDTHVAALLSDPALRWAVRP